MSPVERAAPGAVPASRLVALVDCSAFYCSCERVFRPDLDGRPVVVLSNNDGCVIARTSEAKALGWTWELRSSRCRMSWLPKA